MMSAPPVLRRVLCAVDVQRETRSPLALASVVAEHFEAQLDGLYVATPTSNWDSRVERVKRLIVEHNARGQLETLLAPFGQALDVDSFVTRGNAADEILAHADVHQSDLIVCGISGNSRIGEGSRRLASTVASRASSAVLTVPGDSPACAVRRILLVITTKDATAPALSWAQVLAERFEASISLVRLEPTARRFWAGFGQSSLQADCWERQRAAAQQRIAAFVEDAELEIAELLSPERDAAGIATLAETENFDLVVVGLPHTATRGDTSPTVLSQLRRASTVPTLSVRAPCPRLKYLSAASAPAGFADNYQHPLDVSA